VRSALRRPSQTAEIGQQHLWLWLWTPETANRSVPGGGELGYDRHFGAAGMNSYDVLVVGAGPVGMWLAAELHRGGARPAVLERRGGRPPHSKALTIYPRTLEQFAMRGIAARWTAEGTPVPSSHFAILTNRLDFSFLDTEFPTRCFFRSDAPRSCWPPTSTNSVSRCFASTP
jgi:hypothetical protein